MTAALQKSDADLIAEHLEVHGAKVCPLADIRYLPRSQFADFLPAAMPFVRTGKRGATCADNKKRELDFAFGRPWDEAMASRKEAATDGDVA